MSYLAGLVFFPVFFTLSMNLLLEADDLSHSQFQVLFLLAVYSLSIFGYKERNQSDFSIYHLVATTGKGQFSFQSQRKAMPKNAQTTAHCTHLTC